MIDEILDESELGVSGELRGLFESFSPDFFPQIMKEIIMNRMGYFFVIL
jgi:hypothetical protein